MQCCRPTCSRRRHYRFRIVSAALLRLREPDRGMPWHFSAASIFGFGVPGGKFDDFSRR